MKSIVFALVLSSLLTLSFQTSTAFGQSTTFTYQGRVTDNGTNFNGGGQFKFALVTTDGTTMTWWSNDGTSVNGSQPTAAVSIGVSNGLFTVVMGNTALPNMNAIPAAIFATEPNLQLLIWFNDGVNGFAELIPPQTLTPTPVATFANSASNLLGTLPAVQLNGTLPLAQLPAGVITNNETSSVTLDNLTLGGTLTMPGFPVTMYSGGNLLLRADGNYNFFVGAYAGNLTTSGSGNTGIGDFALESNTSGFDNTAEGIGTLDVNGSGSYNTADGGFALNRNATGNYNTANGFYALDFNTNGSFNTANGETALFSNTSGSDNTANGVGALYYNANGFQNTAAGFQALYSNTNGGDNTAMGVNALYDNTIGSSNIALGYSAGSSITGGSFNIDIGNSGASTDTNITRIGSSQSATYLAGTIYGNDLNLSTAEITAGGMILLYSSWIPANFYAGQPAGNPAGDNGLDNTALGNSTLVQNTSGSYNTASGAHALLDNISGSGNTASGAYSLYEGATGSYNTADGYSALANLGLGGSGGTNNIALGFNAGDNFFGNESSNIDIGNEGVSGESRIIRIGIPGIQTATYLSGTVYANGVMLTSDRNAKEHFTSIDSRSVLAKVAALPVTEWNYKTDRSTEHIGPMAQDFHAAFGLNGTDDKHISVVDEGGVALAAIQGLNAKLEAENAQLKKRLDDLEAEVKALKR